MVFFYRQPPIFLVFFGARVLKCHRTGRWPAVWPILSDLTNVLSGMRFQQSPQYLCFSFSSLNFYLRRIVLDDLRICGKKEQTANSTPALIGFLSKSRRTGESKTVCIHFPQRSYTK